MLQVFVRTPLFDILLIAIPILTLLGAMPLTIALIVLAVVVLAWEMLGVFALNTLLVGSHRMFRSPFTLVVLWMALSALWSLDGSESLSGAMRFAMLAVLGGLSIQFLTELNAPSAVMQKLFLAVFAGCAGLLALEQIPDGAVIAFASTHLDGDYARYMRKTVNRGLCAFTVFVWPAMFLLWRMGKPILAWLLMLLVAIPVLLMNSMSAQLGLVLGIATFLLCRGMPRRMSRALVILVPLAFVSVPYVTSALLASQAVATHKATLTDVSAGRIPIWESLLSMSSLKPLLGWGMGVSSEVPMAQDIMDSIGLKEPPLHPHLSALHVKLELGIIGLLLIGFTLYVLLKRIVRADLVPTHYAMVMACIVAYLGAGLSSFGVWQNWWVASAWIAALLFARFARQGA